ncbi:MAG: PEP-utilizing enzyme [Patescibacteria group bacterium]
MSIRYFKEFARNYSLFQVVAYAEFAARSTPEMKQRIDTGHPLFIYSGGSLAEIFYPQGELGEIFKRFGKLAADAGYFEGVASRFLEVVDEISPFFEKKKTVADLSGLKSLYELYLDYLYGESVIWTAPLIESLPAEIKSRAMSIREATQELTSLRDALFDHNLAKLFPELGDLAHFVLPQTVFSGCSVDVLVEEAKRYKNGFIYFEGTIHVGERDEVLAKLGIDLVDEAPKEAVNELRGQVASVGKVKGLAKLVFTKSDLHKVDEGDILVSPMTRPDFLSAMILSAAFITDEGGITCHAAIVSREMKKPCIIGTKIATKVLKDGDEVEVDADNGIVRILKRA